MKFYEINLRLAEFEMFCNVFHDFKYSSEDYVHLKRHTCCENHVKYIHDAELTNSKLTKCRGDLPNQLTLPWARVPCNLTPCSKKYQ